MSLPVPARVVAVALALVLGSAVATAAVRLRGGGEQVPVSAPTPASPGPASPPPSTGTPTPTPGAPSRATPTPGATPTPTPTPTPAPLPTPTSSAPSPTATADSSPPPPRSAAVRRALAERVLPPPGAVGRLGDDRAGIGLLDATDVAALDEGSDRAAAARRLEALGFEQALGCGWKTYDRVYVVVVHRFATPAGAEQLVSDVAARLPGPAFRSRTVPAAVAYSGHSVLYWEQWALFARGRYAYRLTFLSRQEDFRHRVFDELLERQAAHAARLDP